MTKKATTTVVGQAQAGQATNAKLSEMMIQSLIKETVANQNIVLATLDKAQLENAQTIIIEMTSNVKGKSKEKNAERKALSSLEDNVCNWMDKLDAQEILKTASSIKAPTKPATPKQASKPPATPAKPVDKPPAQAVQAVQAGGKPAGKKKGIPKKQEGIVLEHLAEYKFTLPEDDEYNETIGIVQYVEGAKTQDVKNKKERWTIEVLTENFLQGIHKFMDKNAEGKKVEYTRKFGLEKI